MANGAGLSAGQQSTFSSARPQPLLVTLFPETWRWIRSVGQAAGASPSTRFASIPLPFCSTASLISSSRVGKVTQF